MTSYRERQHDTARFYEGEELLKTFRGVGKKVIEASKKFAHDHWRIQKVLSEAAIYSALREDLVWDQVSDVVDDLSIDVRDNPRAYCAPPDIPDDWDSLRKALTDYAPADWWYRVLRADDFCKAATWRSYLSRPDVPKWLDDLRTRARDWRSRVLQGLDRWEVGVKEKTHWASMIDFRVKDALDAHGEEVAFEAFRHLYQFDQGASRWMPITKFYHFDPANPEGPQFDFLPKDEDDVRAAFRACIEAGFPNYHDGTPQPTQVVASRETREFASDDLQYAWQALAEVEVTMEWDPVIRAPNVTKKVRRIRVKASVRHAMPTEVVERERVRVKDHCGHWDDTFQEFVWRWRAFDHDRDTLGGVEGRDRVQRICGIDDPDAINAFLMPISAPIEDVGGYTVD